VKNKAILSLLVLAFVGVLSACANTNSIVKEHPAKLTSAPDCGACHSGELASMSHKSPGFFGMHRHYAQKRLVCAACHQESFCSDCHARKVEIKPSELHADSPERELPHRGDYLSRHRIDGKISPASCARCHGRQNNERCVKCHR